MWRQTDNDVSGQRPTPVKHVLHLRKRRHRPRQLELQPRTWGGRHEGAGRPSLGRVPRVARPPVASRFPVHVTLKLDESLPNLRPKPLFGVIEPCLKQGKEREGFRLVHYSVQGHHLHLIVEAQSAQALGAGIKGLSVRIARRRASHADRWRWGWVGGRPEASAGGRPSRRVTARIARQRGRSAWPLTGWCREPRGSRRARSDQPPLELDAARALSLRAVLRR